MSAAEARRGSTLDVAARLAADKSMFAVMPGDEHGLRDMIVQIGVARDGGIPKGTRQADEWGFGWAVKFGRATLTRWMRPRIGDNTIDVTLEAWYEAVKLFWVSHHMQPGKKRRERGYTQALPSSALMATYGHRRVMRDCGRYIGDLSLTHDVLRGLCQMYKQLFGPDAFASDQAEIYANWMLDAIEKMLLASSVPSWTHELHIVWLAIHTFLIATGTRKDEWTRASLLDDCLMRINFVWVDDVTMVPLPMTIATIASRRKGSMLRGQSSASKCDRLNIVWIKQKQWFRLDEDEPYNFAYAFQQYELAFPCPEDQRSTWPAFSPTGDEHAFSPHAAAYQHKQLCIAAIGAKLAADRTIHSYRGTLASKHAAARAAGAAHLTHAVTQAHTRHKTLEALLSYEKMRPHNFADNVELSNRTDAGASIQNQPCR